MAKVVIDNETWEVMQLKMKIRKECCREHKIQKLYYATNDNPISARIICGKCGRVYGRKVWNSTNDKLRRIIWQCSERYVKKGEIGCDNNHIDDEVFYKSFIIKLFG